MSVPELASAELLPAANSLNDQGRTAIGRLGREGTLAHWGAFVAGRVPSFTGRDWLTMFRRVPRLRPALLVGAVVNALANRTLPQGRALPFSARTFSSFSYVSIYNDTLILEALAAWLLGDARGQGAATLLEPLRAAAARHVRFVLSSSRSVSYEGRPLMAYSCMPQRRHLRRTGLVGRLYMPMLDAATPDNDSTSLILDGLLGLDRALGLGLQDEILEAHPPLRHVRFLQEHVFGAGAYGQGALSYEPAKRHRYSGVLTWVFDHHNELDPTVNVNVLGYLAQLLICTKVPPTREMAELSDTVLRFIHELATHGEFFSPRWQQYYPLGSALFLWHRLLTRTDRLSGEALRLFDPKARVPAISEVLYTQLGSDRVGALMGPYDRYLAEPFRRRFRGTALSAVQPPPPKEPMHHFFHINYPIMVACFSADTPMMVALHLAAQQTARAREHPCSA